MPKSKTLFVKFGDTLKPLYDFRAWLLLLFCAGVGLMVDPASTSGLAGYLVYAVGIWGASLMLSKVLTPYMRMSDYVQAAIEDGNMAAAVIAVGRIFLTICIAFSILYWGK